MEENEERRKGLSDDDIKRIASELESRLVNRFFWHLGKGFWAIVWRGVLLIAIAIATYGAFKAGNVDLSWTNHKDAP